MNTLRGDALKNTGVRTPGGLISKDAEDACRPEARHDPPLLVGAEDSFRSSLGHSSREKTYPARADDGTSMSDRDRLIENVAKVICA